MLKSIDPIQTPDLLWLLASMGHSDDLVVVDANHPATRIARDDDFAAPDPVARHEHGDGGACHHERSIRSTISIPIPCA